MARAKKKDTLGVGSPAESSGGGYWSLDDDDGSDFSGSSAQSGTLDGVSSQEIEVLLQEAVDKISEKRGSTRLEGYSAFIRLTMHSLEHDFLSRKLEDLGVAFRASIKKGDEVEAVKAIRAAELVCMTLGTEGDMLYKSLLPLVHTAAKNHESEVVRAAALTCSGILSFIASHHVEDAIQTLRFYKQFMRRRAHGVAAASLTSWALLCSGLPSALIRGQLKASYWRIFMQLLESDDVDVRMNAGVCIALIYDHVWQGSFADDSADDEEEKQPASEEKDDHFEDEEEDSSAEDDVGGFEDPDDEDLPNEYDMELSDLHTVLSQLAKDGTRSRGRKERSQQRSLFRTIVQVVEEGLPPRMKFKVGKDQVELTRWTQIVQFTSFRSVLRSGLHKHLAENEIIQTVLDLFLEDAAPTLSKADRSQQMSDKKETTKIRKENKKDARKKKNAFKFED